MAGTVGGWDVLWLGRLVAGTFGGWDVWWLGRLVAETFGSWTFDGRHVLSLGQEAFFCFLTYVSDIFCKYFGIKVSSY
jgi:hypothetical protein